VKEAKRHSETKHCFDTYDQQIILQKGLSQEVRPGGTSVLQDAQGRIYRIVKPQRVLLSDANSVLNISASPAFQHCAVVGNSGALKGKGFGPLIDNATVVFRFNDAPSIGHTQDVGRSTNIRIQNFL